MRLTMTGTPMSVDCVSDEQWSDSRRPLIPRTANNGPARIVTSCRRGPFERVTTAVECVSANQRPASLSASLSGRRLPMLKAMLILDRCQFINLEIFTRPNKFLNPSPPNVTILCGGRCYRPAIPWKDKEF